MDKSFVLEAIEGNSKEIVFQCLYVNENVNRQSSQR